LWLAAEKLDDHLGQLMFHLVGFVDSHVLANEEEVHAGSGQLLSEFLAVHVDVSNEVQVAAA
jgi:hypothetical protein